jgi:hypothetical protein
MSTNEVLAQSMEDMLQSPTRAPAQAENQHALMAEPNQGGTVAGCGPARLRQRDFIGV